MVECAKSVYRPRRPREIAFYRLVEEHYERFEQAYPERYEDRYGHFRSVIRETVYTYLGCGDLKQGFARVRCRGCGHEYLLAYSCKRRYFCTSCHTKRAVAFAEWLQTTVLWPVAHRQIVLTIPKMLREPPGRASSRRSSRSMECPDCGGAMRIVAFIEEQRVVRAILEHLSLWDEARPPPALPAAPRAPVELEYLPCVE